MQYLGSEICKLCSFLEVQLTHGQCVLHHTWVVIMHAIDVCPYLYLFGLNGSTQEACGIVGTAAQQIVNLAVGIAADESLDDVNLLARILLQRLSALLADVVEVRIGILVGTHNIKSAQKHGFHTLLQQIVGHHVGAHDLALSENHLLLERGEMHFGERTEVVKFLVQECERLVLPLLGAV